MASASSAFRGTTNLTTSATLATPAARPAPIRPIVSPATPDTTGGSPTGDSALPVPAAVPPAILQGPASAVSPHFTSSRATAWPVLPTVRAAAMDPPAQPAHPASWSQISAYSVPTPHTRAQQAAIAVWPLTTSSVAPNVQIHTS